jgi:hypothetical protein
MNAIPSYRLILIAVLGLSLTSASVKAAEWTNTIPDAVRMAFDNAEQFELLSLNPDFHEQHEPNEEFHGWRILGKMAVKNADTRKELVTSLEKAAKESNGFGANCFNPRHVIQVMYKGKSYALAICFECKRVVIYENEKQSATVLITDSAQNAESLFNRVLMKQKIPLAGK